EATYTRPYQSHGSIGPSCAVAQSVNDAMTVWTHTQGVYPDRQAIAEMLRVPPTSVRLIHVEGSGCYGHNGADDAAADSAARRRRRPQRHSDLQIPERQGGASLHPRNAAADFGDARARRLSQFVLDREFHGCTR